MSPAALVAMPAAIALRAERAAWWGVLDAVRLAWREPNSVITREGMLRIQAEIYDLTDLLSDELQALYTRARAATAGA